MLRACFEAFESLSGGMILFFFSEFTPEELHEEMYTILKELGIKPQKAFQAIYKTVIGKKQGPRAASFILSLNKDFVINRFRMLAQFSHKGGNPARFF